MDPKPVRRFNFARLIMLYVSKFEITCIAEAIQYYFLLRNMQDVNGINLFLLCVSDLIQETGEYEKILGKIERNGLRTKGLLDNLSNLPVTTEGIAKATGDKFVQKGMFEEAINLYDIANVIHLFLKLQNLLYKSIFRNNLKCLVYSVHYFHK